MYGRAKATKHGLIALYWGCRPQVGAVITKVSVGGVQYSYGGVVPVVDMVYGLVGCCYD